MITIKEAHDRFGDLARIQNGYTRWIEVRVANGTWVPIFDNGFLIGYEFVGDPK